jgi:hypothetical protein
MDQPIDRQQLIEEINLIPDSHLRPLFDLLHYFRLGLQAADPETCTTPSSQASSVLASLAGSWEGDLVREPQGDYEQRLELE